MTRSAWQSRQLTAIDTATRVVVAQLITGRKTAQRAVAFLELVLERLGEVGIELTGVLSGRLDDIRVGGRRDSPEGSVSVRGSFGR